MYLLRRDPLGATTWRKPILYSFFCMLPFAALQVLSAWWSSWLESTLDDNDELGRLPFATYSAVPCPGQDPVTLAPLPPTPGEPAPLPVGARCALCLCCSSACTITQQIVSMCCSVKLHSRVA
jgi:hypothetical protein